MSKAWVLEPHQDSQENSSEILMACKAHVRASHADSNSQTSYSSKKIKHNSNGAERNGIASHGKTLKM